MAEITAAAVRELRERTGIGMMDCKKALTEADGDMDKAVELLRKKGMAAVEKRSGKDANEGVIMSYIHPGSRLGVLIEVNCETDFVARTDDFQDFARDVAMHIAAEGPIAVRREDVDADVVAKEKEIYVEQAKNEGKPDNIAEKIVEGKLNKFFKESTLLAQPFVKDPDKTIEELVTEVSATVGEKIEIARFARMKVGER